MSVATANTPTGRGWASKPRMIAWTDPDTGEETIRTLPVNNIVELTRVASDGTVKGAASKLVSRLMDLMPMVGRSGYLYPDEKGRWKIAPHTKQLLGGKYEFGIDQALTEREPFLFITYQLASESGSTYKGLRGKGLRPVAYLKGKQTAGGSRSGGEQALAQIDKIRWEFGDGALPADWSLLEKEAPSPAPPTPSKRKRKKPIGLVALTPQQQAPLEWESLKAVLLLNRVV